MLFSPPDFRQFTLDPNATDYRPRLSDGNTTVTNPPSNYQDFKVFCKESVCEQCYWEVEWSRRNGISIAASYESRNEYMLGHNGKSWNLLCGSTSYSFLHNKQEPKNPIEPSSSIIGVFVDHKAGIRSFYSVSDTAKLLHKIKTKFTQPLYLGFTVNSSSTVKLCHSK